jgi:predicted house-cleaning noncanonical NTP pyrophosphatase (MazG superfamily)
VWSRELPVWLFGWLWSGHTDLHSHWNFPRLVLRKNKEEKYVILDMMTYHYNKLVRDKIEENAKKRGEKVVVRRATTDAEFWHLLKTKLQEEIDEFANRPSMKSVVDILEVVDTMIEFQKFDKKEVAAVRENKNIDEGTFTKRLVLEQSSKEIGHPQEQ